jgi:hypothetical protein
MQSLIEAILFNSWAYMGFIGVIIGLIYLILFILVKIHISKTKEGNA